MPEKCATVETNVDLEGKNPRKKVNVVVTFDPSSKHVHTFARISSATLWY